jgi:ribonuclease HI
MNPALHKGFGVKYGRKGGVKRLDIYIDGASQGNPGPSGIGVVICEDGKTIKNISSFIGNATNNVAEYTALIYALQEALMLKAQSLKINTDSELLHRQLRKIYKIKNANILGLYNQAEHLMSAFKEINIDHIPRENNRGADRLAAKAIKEAISKKVLR